MNIREENIAEILDKRNFLGNFHISKNSLHAFRWQLYTRNNNMRTFIIKAHITQNIGS